MKEIKGKGPKNGNTIGMSEKKHRIDDCWMYISEDTKGEGVCGMMTSAVTGTPIFMPLVAADEERLRALKPMAEQIAKETGKKIKLIKLSTREDIEDINP